MAGFRCCAMGLAALAFGVSGLRAAEPVALRERVKDGAGATRVVIALKADGLFLPNTPAGEKEAKAPKPLALKVETKLDFAERVIQTDAKGQPLRALRWVNQAAAAINGEVRPSASVLRPDVALLLAERRDGEVVVISPSGPLTRPELDLVDDVGDPLLLGALLPEKAVTKGDHWRISNDGARGLSGYDVLATNSVEATVEAIDDSSARIAFTGEIRGASYGGGEGTVRASGTFTFDRKAERVRELTLTRQEVRKPGEVEDGLDVKSKLTIERTDAETPATLADSVLKDVPAEITPERLLLLHVAPDGKYTLRHDRDWHIYHETQRQAVLKRLNHGDVVAYCNLTTGPNAGKGRHQDLRQFRDDVRRALGERFGQYLGEGEVEGDPAGGFRYKVAVQGRQGTLGVLWDYFLCAGPEGDQLLVTFTLAEASAKAFGDQDLQLVGSLRWKDAAEPAPKP